MIPTDPLFADQWHLENTGQLGHPIRLDIDVVDVWEDYTGAGIRIGIWDSGVEASHPDLVDGYDASLHVLVDGQLVDPQTLRGEHGTWVAGVIAARNNGIGVVGIAFDATLTGVVIDKFNSLYHAGSMNEQDQFDVANHSWGFGSLGDSRLDPAYALFYQGVEDAADNGRGGLGTIQNVAAGNERPLDDNANLSNFSSIRFVNVIGFVQDIGTLSTSDPGAALLVVAPAENSAGLPHVRTTDLAGAAGAEPGDYEDGFGSTSGAAAMLSGISALILEANPDLGWRDVQTILAASARHIGSDFGAPLVSLETRPWTFNHAATWNGGGHHFSHDYGFGLVDAIAAVRLAETWDLQSTSVNEFKRTGSFTGPLKTKDFETRSFKVTLSKGLAVEAVELELKWSSQHTAIEDLIVELVSPSGTKSYLLDENLGGAGSLPDWIFTSRTFLGEDSGGTWTVKISDVTASDSGIVSGATLRAFGSKDTKDDTYIYTNEYHQYAGTLGHKTELKDTDGGDDAINAAAVGASSQITLIPGKTGKIDSTPLKIAKNTVIEDAFGGDGDDTLVGNGVANVLRGGRGDDQLSGRAKGDKLFGDDGFDYVRYASAPGWVSASLADKFGSVGHADGDSYKSIEGIIGSDFDDFLEGNAFANTLKGRKGLDILQGGGGPDVLRGEEGNDDARGGGGDDDLFGGNGNDGLRGEGGQDELNGSLGADDLRGGSGFDFAIYKFATSGVKANLIQGGSKGEADGDTYSGIEGLIGSGLSDVLWGDAKENVIIGGVGNDELRGLLGDDGLFGDGGNDVLIGGGGADGLDGGAGFDVAQFELHKGVKASLLDGGLSGEAAGDAYLNIEALTGTHYDDKLIGDDKDNQLLGRGGNDIVEGLGGDDFLFGDINKDRLTGGLGRDQLGGGKGADVFDFDSTEESLPWTPDLILDFEDGLDRIDLSTIDAIASTRFDVANDPFTFIGGAGFTGVSGQLRAVPASAHTYVYGDVNGDAVADFEIKMAPSLVLGAEDFVL